MATPNTSISALGLSDINTELKFTSDTPRAINDAILRSLTGVQAQQVVGSGIGFSDLSNKTAFGGITASANVDVTSYGVITRTIDLGIISDMVGTDVVWSANVVSGSPGTLTNNGRNATYKLTGAAGQTVNANVKITATVSYGGHTIGTTDKYISFKIASLPPALVVTGNTSANVEAFAPAVATTTLTASANVVGGSMLFTVSPNDSGVVVSGNSVTLTARAPNVGVEDNRVYNVLTELVYGNQIVAQDNKTVTLRAAYMVPTVTISGPTSNNVFVAAGEGVSSISSVATHNVPNGSISWVTTKVSGDDAVVSTNAASQSLTINVASGSYGAKKSVYDQTAVLSHANGEVITSVTRRLTLRTAVHGMSVSKTDKTESGFRAQTAVGYVTTAFQFGTLSWNVERVSGDTAIPTESISTNSGSVRIDLSTAAPGTKSAVYRVTPVLSYDGLAMYNTPQEVTLSAEQKSYTFSLTGAAANTQLGDAPVSASLASTATHNVANGKVEFSTTGSTGTLTSNNGVATVTLSSNTIASSSYALHASLYDESDRLIETKVLAQTLRAYAPGAKFVGPSSAAFNSYADATASLTVSASLTTSGANNFTLSATKIEGTTLTYTSGGTASVPTGTLSTTRTTVGTNEGLYRFVARTTYFDKTFDKTFDAVVTATKEDAQFTLVGSSQSNSSFNFPVVTAATATANHAVPGGTITWARSGSGTVSSATSNSSVYRYTTSQGSVGTGSSSQTISAALRDADGNLVETKTVAVTTSSVVRDPSLTLNGTASNVVSNTFNANATVILTPSVASGLTGHTYSFSSSATSGSATVTSNSSAIRLYNTFDGAGEARGVYNVTCNVVLNGQVIDTVTRAVTVAAVCPAPTLNISGTNASAASFNFPVETYSYADASSSPAGATFSWSFSRVSGTAASSTYTESSNKRAVVQNKNSTVGSMTNAYDLTCTYKTPNGSTLGTKTVRVTNTATRNNPALTLDYTGGSSASASGGGSSLSASLGLKASVASGLSGHTFSFSKQFVSGNLDNMTLSGNASTGAVTTTYTNVVATHGTNAKSAAYDVYAEVKLNGQTITGAVARRVNFSISPMIVQGVGTISTEVHVWSGTATATISFNPDGSVIVSPSGDLYTWMSPSNTAEAANYEISWDYGATWASLGTAKSQTRSLSTNNSDRTYSGAYRIRRIGTTTLLGSGEWTMVLAVGTPR